MAASPRSTSFWKRATQTWGTRFIDQYGPTPSAEWQAVIDQIDGDQLDRAIGVLRQESPIHPPTLGQLEKAIPSKLHMTESVPDLLAQEMLRRNGHRMCEHQLSGRWNYVGREARDGSQRPYSETEAVVIPMCSVDGCRGRETSYRVNLEDLQQ